MPRQRRVWASGAAHANPTTSWPTATASSSTALCSSTRKRPAANAQLTPATPRWGDVEARKVIQDALVQIAQGGDVATIAAELDEQIESILNG